MAKFYIITPVLNSLSWLKRCVYSVADQVTEDVEVYCIILCRMVHRRMVRWNGFSNGNRNPQNAKGIPLRSRVSQMPVCMMY